MQNDKSFLSLICWIVALVAISSLLGFVTETSTNEWYMNIRRSALTPPGAVFGIVWSILYVLIAIAGWLIWQEKTDQKIKFLYALQLTLNIMWTPIFFYLQAAGLALTIIAVIIASVGYLIWLCRIQLMSVSLILSPYWFWLMFAFYLNGYIVFYN